jgi:hypothetical protein
MTTDTTPKEYGSRDEAGARTVNYLAYGMVGHVDLTSSPVRLEGGQVLVEVTLQPSGDEIVARLETGAGGDGQAFYMPLAYGARVIVGMPAGTGSEPVILARCPDGAWPFPTTVAGIATGAAPAGPTAKTAPMYAILRTQEGHLIAIESGDGGDIVIHSGGSVQVKVNAGEQILLKGRTHLGSGFTAPPQGASIGPAGEMVPGVQGAPYVPVPYVPAPVPPIPLPPPALVPADGLVRVKDPVQADATSDPDFFVYLALVHAQLLVLVPPGTIPPDPPLAIGSHHKGASQHTASDA